MKKTTLLATTFGLLLLGSVAHADNQEDAAAFFQKGETAKNLGRYDEAAEWYIKAYEAWPAPEFLYNIGQAYRLGGKCKDALHFYKRFLKLKAKDTEAPLSQKKIDQINEFIVSLEECVKDQEAAADKQPDETDDPKNPDPVTDPNDKDGDGKPDTEVAAVDPETETDDLIVFEEEPYTATMVSVHAAFGAAMVAVGPSDVPIQGSFFVSAGYPVPAGPATIDAGVGIGYTPLPYRTTTGMSEMASLTAFVANAGATYPVTNAIGVRGEVGLGVQTLGGLVAGNPFTVDGQPATGALGLFNFRFAVSGQYWITKNIAASLTPFSLSVSPKKEGMESGVTAIDFLVGVGYRM